MCLTRLFAALSRFISDQYVDRGYIHRKYLLGEYDEYDESMTTVPEDCIYVEEWRKQDEVRRRVIYELEEITPYEGNPFAPFKNPWNWIGDASTDVDITAAVDRYLMPGNEIRLDLLLLFLRSHSHMSIRYTDAASGDEIVFPNKGVRIEADGAV